MIVPDLVKAIQAGAKIHAGDGGYEIGNWEAHEKFVLERNKSRMVDFHEAVKMMHTGRVVQYFGTVNGDVYTKRGMSFCMCRGVIFTYNDEGVQWNMMGHMVYDPDFRYIETGETVDPRGWQQK